MSRTVVLLAVVPVAASLVTLFLSQRHSRRMAVDERQARSEQVAADRAFQARESRYADRRDAAIAMITAAEAEVTLILRWEYQGEFGSLAPGDMHEDHEFTDVDAAYARVALLAAPPVPEAASALREAVIGRFFGKEGSESVYLTALTHFEDVARGMLAAE